MLSNMDIKEKIDGNNRIIESLFNPNVYTLNNTVAELLEENKKLQAQCQHEFKESYCVFCYCEEKK